MKIQYNFIQRYFSFFSATTIMTTKLFTFLLFPEPAIAGTNIRLITNKHGVHTGIVIEGSIEHGAFANFERKIKQGRGFISNVFLRSPGGDVEEAIKIGRLIRELKIKTNVPIQSKGPHACYGQKPLMAENCTCESACFLIFAGGVDRSGYIVGLHRSYYPHQYLRTMSAEEATSRTKAARAKVDQYLTDMEVPRSFIDRALATPSEDMDFLTSTEIEKYFSGFTPDVDEWVKAKCGNFNKTMQKFVNDIHNDKLASQVDDQSNCWIKTHFKMVEEAFEKKYGKGAKLKNQKKSNL
jgi:hypothetical protein